MELSKKRVNRAGDWLRDCAAGVEPWDDERVEAEIAVIIAWRDEHADPLNLCIPDLQNWVEAESSTGIPPVQRLKRGPRMLEKLRRHPTMKLARMQDIGGARAVLGSLNEVDAVAQRIRGNWKVVREVDYCDTPREDTGYRALHVMVERDERVVEIQRRALTFSLSEERPEAAVRRRRYSRVRDLGRIGPANGAGGHPFVEGLARDPQPRAQPRSTQLAALYGAVDRPGRQACERCRFGGAQERCFSLTGHGRPLKGLFIN